MDVHFVDADDGKTIGMQIDFGEPEAVGVILMFSGFLMNSEDPERAHFAGTINALSTILAKGLTVGALELEAPKDPPPPPPDYMVPDETARRVPVTIRGKAWEAANQFAPPGWLDDFPADMGVAQGGYARADLGEMDEDRLRRLIAAFGEAHANTDTGRDDRAHLIKTIRDLRTLLARGFRG